MPDRLVGALLLLLGISGWSGGGLAREIPFTLVLTGNVEGRLVNGDERGGWLDVARVLRQTRERVRSPILIDMGNATSGSPDALLLDGEDWRYLFEELNYDVLVPGIEEAKGGLARLQGIAAASKIRWLAANVRALPGRRDTFTGRVASVLLERDGVKIWLTAFVDPGFLLHALPEDWPNLMIADPGDVLAGLRRELRAHKPDVVVCVLPEGPVDRDMWARLFPECDLFVVAGGGGLSEPRAAARPAWVHAPDARRGVAVVKARYDNLARALVHVEAGRAPAGKTPVFDDRLYQHFLTESEWAARRLDQSPTGGLDRRVLLRTRVSALAREAGAELAMVGLLPGGRNTAASMREVWEPLGGGGEAWMLADLTRGELERLLAQGEDRRPGPRIETLGFLMEGGPGASARAVGAEDGRPLHSGKRMTVLVDRWLAASAGGAFPAFRRILLDPRVRLRPSPVSLFEEMEEEP